MKAQAGRLRGSGKLGADCHAFVVKSYTSADAVTYSEFELVSVRPPMTYNLLSLTMTAGSILPTDIFAKRVHVKSEKFKSATYVS